MSKTILLVLLIALCPAVDLTVRAAIFNEFVVATTVLDGAKFDIHDGRVVWTDNRVNPLGDIYGIDLVTSQEFIVSNHSGPKMMPDIYGDIVVWMDSRTWIGDIYSYDLVGGYETQLAGPGDQWDPDIYQNLTFWMDKRNGNWDIYGHDFTTGTELIITSNSADQVEPAVYGNIVVWQDFRNGSGNRDIYGYDITTSTEFQISSDPTSQSSPRIFGDSVVWRDNRSGSTEIYGYDLRTSTEFAITSNSTQKRGCSIGGDLVVWADDRNGNFDIFGYYISTGTEFQITDDPADQYTPQVDGDIVVWYDYRNGPVNIYGADVSLMPLGIDVLLNQSQFTTGDTLIADVLVTNDETPDDVEVKVWLELASGGNMSLYNVPSYTVPAFTFLTRPLTSYKFKGGEHVGSYQFGGRFLDIITGEELSSDIEPFDFTP